MSHSYCRGKVANQGHLHEKERLFAMWFPFLAACLTGLIVFWSGFTDRREKSMNSRNVRTAEAVALPPIDMRAPAHVETATFALG